MTVRIIEWQVPYTWGTAIEITPDKVINLLLRAENNLLHVNDDNELFCDLQLESWIAPTDDFPVWVTTGIVNQADGWSQNWLLLRYQTTSWAYAQWLYGADGNLYYDGWTGIWKQVYYADQIMNILQDYIRWVDFNFVNKTWQTNITLSDMSTAISPTADFTVNAPDPVEDGYVYLLRVSNWVSPYTMTLWNGISNPRNVDLTLTANGEDMFAFLAVWWILELQPEVDISNEAYSASWNWVTNIAPSKNAMYGILSDIIAKLNTRTFYLADTADLTTAQAAYDWYNEGKNPLLIYNEECYSILELTPNMTYGGDSWPALKFQSIPTFHSGASMWNSWDSIPVVNLCMFGNPDEITNIVVSDLVQWKNYLCTGIDYQAPYSPEYDWSPATKKYVDDHADFAFVTPGSDSTLTIENFSTIFEPDQDFDIEAWTLKEWMQYIVRVNTQSTAYIMTLWTWVTNPFGETLTLTANKMTTIVLLATSDSTLEIFSVRTES